MSILKWLNSSSQYVEVSPSNPLPVNATVTATASTVAKATAAAPTYSEGDVAAPLSVDLAGGLRITGTINASSSMRSTTAAPSYVNGTDNSLSSNLTGDLRVIAKQSGSWVISAGSALIGSVSIDQTTNGTTNAVDVLNLPLTLDVNSGVKSNSTIRVVLATDQPALTNALKVDPSAVTSPISAASLPLPTGAATAAKQPALGTAGASSTDVISVQGIASGTALAVSGTFWQATQPVSGSVTANAGTNLNTSALALETGGNLATLAGFITATVGQVNVKQINGVTTLMGNGVTGTGSQRVTLASDNSAVALWGQGATAATVPANAVLKGVRGTTANPTAVTDGQMVGAMADKLGKQIVVIGAPRDLKADASITLTASTSETTLIAAVASTFLDIYGLIIENTSATICEVSFRDTTGGTVRFNIEVPANDTRGFMLPSSDGYKQATVNTNWTAQCGTSVSSIKISALYVKNI